MRTSNPVTWGMGIWAPGVHPILHHTNRCEQTQRMATLMSCSNCSARRCCSSCWLCSAQPWFPNHSWTWAATRTSVPRVHPKRGERVAPPTSLRTSSCGDQVMTLGPFPQPNQGPDIQDSGCVSAAAALCHHNLQARRPRAGAPPRPHPTQPPGPQVSLLCQPDGHLPATEH